MIRIIDRTLSCLDSFQPSCDQLTDLVSLLFCAGADVIELSEQAYHTIGQLPHGNYILRIKDPGDTTKYPDFKKFICRRGNCKVKSVYAEVQINDIREVKLSTQYVNHSIIRICGLDDIMQLSLDTVFQRIKKSFLGRIEFCPENQYFTATALAVEWILSGGTDVVTSFGGISGFAAFEEVEMALRIIKRRKPHSGYDQLPKIKKLLEQITGIMFDPNKPITGENIFDVESGIHVDGIVKQPKCYEPFPPELVGATRRIVIGKYSGKTSLSLKLAQMGITLSLEAFQKVQQTIKDICMDKKTSLTDEEIIQLINKIR